MKIENPSNNFTQTMPGWFCLDKTFNSLERLRLITRSSNDHISNSAIEKLLNKFPINMQIRSKEIEGFSSRLEVFHRLDDLLIMFVRLRIISETVNQDIISSTFYQFIDRFYKETKNGHV